MECSEVTPESVLIDTEDMETLLTALRAKADEAINTGVSEQQDEHPSVSFYRGNRPVKIKIPPRAGNSQLENEKDNDNNDNDNCTSCCCLHVIGLHQALLPPCQGRTYFTEEERSARLSSTDGLELLRLNWELLLWLLMPSVRTGFLPNKGEMYNKEKEEKEKKETSTPISSLQELQIPLTWNDYTQLRQPGMMDRVHYSYVVFIRFYGWRIHDEESGVLDRHQNWRMRYKTLLQNCKMNNKEEEKSVCCGLGNCCFYSALTRILRVLLDLCFTHYAINLVAFILEEMNKGRLLTLQSSLETCWLPQIIQSKQVPLSEKDRLRRQLYRLTHSDSD
ncbi:Opioid growth factor receptor (OGFr) conserved domain [Trypanosoma melophagium]|uniref:Opioid growth factor receptor (OGFr) conserved domain n=1 Tax=Trypanosoma melophagium TaxID=715481 RepID=UPI00351A9C80|nr:Opioid growth factor receptor (OGFr) conserved domain [Trypanosoma melophagium]